jgi:hydrogenase nickel incorporation protein HypB
MKILMAQDILKVNDDAATMVRRNFEDRNIFVINLISSPGSGKTTFLETTLTRMAGKTRMAVIEGDLFTARDAERIEKTGVDVVQINTSGACHLDANMVQQAVEKISLENVQLIFIENVGNLVCPSEFDLGENMKMTLLSVTEGDDKPEKYPFAFKESQVAIINKMDLIRYVNFDLEAAKKDIRRINRDIKIFEVSSTTGAGFDDWIDYLDSRLAGSKGQRV